MTGNEFVSNIYIEKENMLNSYINNNDTFVGKELKELEKAGASRDKLTEIIDAILIDTFYSILLGLDGESSFNGIQQTYKLYDENNNLLNECGQLEAAAFEHFYGKE
ncbi:hypothetical protein KPL42_15110 [Clostridium gasigenes]|uniref:hypothetical protein n=1 Tax=Clostridium gasigenes TaxID=94869 RepID=UPI001C0B68D4|nr:hypothetical protein [Clostridium gasigenes]MBU3089814.1 hypothetical protein [Clostridium gasigenes]